MSVFLGPLDCCPESVQNPNVIRRPGHGGVRGDSPVNQPWREQYVLTGHGTGAEAGDKAVSARRSPASLCARKESRREEREREREREARPPARPRARSQHPRTHNLLPPPRPHRIHAARKRDRSHFSPSSASPSRCRDPNTQLFLFFCFFFPFPTHPLSFELSHARCCCWCKTKSFLVRSLEIQNRIHFIWVPTCCCIGRQLLLLLLSTTYIPIKCFGSYQGLPFDNAVDLNFSLNFFWGGGPHR